MNIVLESLSEERYNYLLTSMNSYSDSDLEEHVIYESANICFHYTPAMYPIIHMKDHGYYVMYVTVSVHGVTYPAMGSEDWKGVLDFIQQNDDDAIIGVLMMSLL